MMTRDDATPTLRVTPPEGLSIARCPGLIAALLALALAVGVAAAEVPRPATRFAAEIAAHFDLWDEDGDGDLSFQETSRLVPDTAIRDEAAAALAAVHLAQRLPQWKQAPFRRTELVTAPGGAPGRRPPFEAYYEECFAHIRATGRGLF